MNSSRSALALSFALFATGSGIAVTACESEHDGKVASVPNDGDDASTDANVGAHDGSSTPDGTGGTTRVCDAPGTAGYSLENVTSSGQARSYHLFVPSAYDATAALPVIVAFHGDGEQGPSMRAAGLEEASNGAAIVVYPNGNGTTWDLETAPTENVDFAFFDDVVADVARKLCIDTSRLFVFGMSRGGFFANQLGCYRGDKIRGLVAHSGGGPYSNNPGDFDDSGLFKACTTAPPAAMLIHGSADTDVPIASGEKSAYHWRVKNGCGESLTSITPSPCVAYTGCPAGHPVAWCAVDGLAHALWSSAGAASWSFFGGL